MFKKAVILSLSLFIIMCGVALYNIYMYNALQCEVSVTAAEYSEGIVLNRLNDSREWDSLIVLKPYSELDISYIDMPILVRSSIKSNRNSDNKCTLLFLSGSDLKGYAYVPRNLFDFSRIEGTRFGREDIAHVYKKNGD